MSCAVLLTPGTRLEPPPAACAPLPSVIAAIAPSPAGDAATSSAIMRFTSGRITMNSTTRPSSIMTPSSMTYITSSLVNCSMPSRPVRSFGLYDRKYGHCFGKSQVVVFDLVTTLLVEADRRAHQGGDPVKLLLA